MFDEFLRRFAPGMTEADRAGMDRYVEEFCRGPLEGGDAGTTRGPIVARLPGSEVLETKGEIEMPLAKPFEVGNVAGRERKKMYVRPKRPGPGYQKIRCACGDVAGWAEGHRGRGNPEPRGICQACKDRAAAATAATTTET